ncbi:MAG: 16S rRNA (adenine(1518)-N(6)/adenine(1519)-N(6))-dimethyltransferase RsmA [Ureaplasma sp.]|nr:16S rRNA (adenine(1518)-N(6)/adenine(1519)-N(6))-dimethyltransferase RsmA [Ureaplasma sp.]
MNKNNTLNYIKTENFVASKKLGQNFLVNADIKRKIVNSANIKENKFIVEIGPGLGSITEIILENKNINLLAIELDKRLYDFLGNKFGNYANFKIINNDVLDVNLDEIVDRNFIVIANLPYSISSKIIARLCSSKNIEYAIIMVQKEMAQRICAKPNSSNYNGFSAWLSLCADIEFLFDVSAKNFIPPPKVMSTVVKINFKNRYSTEQLLEYKNFFSKCFASKRKTLVNNLSNFFDRNKVVQTLYNLSIDKNIRAENLSANELLNILEKLNQF